MTTDTDVLLSDHARRAAQASALLLGGKHPFAALDHVLAADPLGGWVDAEGEASYGSVVDWTLARGFMPAVVPHLRALTLADAVAGIGIGASSFRHGLVHDTLLEIEVLLPGGGIVQCTRDNEHADLFFGFPNSYGTLGHVLRARLGGLPVQPFVRVRHQVMRDPGAFFAAMAQACAGDADFVEGMVFDARQLVLSTASFVPDTPWRSEQRGAHAWRQSLRERDEDFLAVRDWLGRWDEDTATGHTLRDHLQEGWAHWRGRYHERVVQDVAIPMSRAPQFTAFLMEELGSEPAWVCPLRAALPGCDFPLYPLRSDEPSVNFGVRSAMESSESHAPGHFGRRLEQETARLGGLSSLDAGCSLAPEDFDEAYDMAAYARLKSRYDPQARAPHLYAACVRRP